MQDGVSLLNGRVSKWLVLGERLCLNVWYVMSILASLRLEEREST